MRDKGEIGQAAAKLLSRWCLRKNNKQRKRKGRNTMKNTNLLNLRCCWDVQRDRPSRSLEMQVGSQVKSWRQRFGSYSVD